MAQASYWPVNHGYDPRVKRFVPLLLSVFSLIITGCGGGASDTALPGAPDLLSKSATAMKAVKTVHFTIGTEGKPAVPVKRAEGDLTSAAEAKGSLQIEVLGNLQEFEFVLLKDAAYVKGATGGFQKWTRQQVLAIYDPSTVLTGVPQLLSTAVDAHTEAAEKVGEADAYKVGVTLSQQVLSKLVPGVNQGVNGTVWVAKADSRLAKIELPLSGGTVTVLLNDYDAPVTVAPPVS
ncbi:LppX_LprAFG lipoprotein [Streptosporangiaceae bacterium NEAU-GS5]|nr:LppX_LprAFG lipoprotein [Streptosporangiaceae bacterium NEAU-GS5]